MQRTRPFTQQRIYGGLMRQTRRARSRQCGYGIVRGSFVKGLVWLGRSPNLGEEIESDNATMS